MKKKIGIFILVLISFLFLSIHSSAYSNYPLPVPTENNGLVPKNRKNSGLVWNEALLEFEISEFPTNYDNYFSKNKNTLTSTYTISNPSNTSIKETFYLPFCEIEDLGSYVKNRTSIYINDVKIDPTIRHIFGYDASVFYMTQGTSISNSYHYYNNYYKDTVVYKLTIQADFTNQTIESTKVNFVVSDDAEAKLLADNFIKNYSDGNEIITFNVSTKNSSCDIYCIGKIPEYSIISDVSTTVETNTISLLQFFCQYRPTHITELDWFNISLEKFKNYVHSENSFTLYTESIKPSRDVLSVMEFIVSLESGQSIKIVTKNPLFPIERANGQEQWRLSGYLFDEIERVKVKVNASCFLEEINGNQQNKKQNEFQFEENYKAYYSFLMNTTVNGGEDDYPALSKDVSLIIQTILASLFYVIPMIIMVVLFVLRKNKTNLILLYVRKFLSYTLFLLGVLFLFGTEYSVSTAIVLLCGLGILTVITIYQNIKQNCRDYNSLVAETICWSICIYYLVSNDIFGIFASIFVFCLIDFLFILFKIRKVANMDSSSINYLPVGVLYGIERWLLYFYFSITLCVTFVTSEALDHFIIFGLPFPFIFIFYILGIYFKQKYFFLKPFREFYKNLDLNALEKKILSRQQLPNLNPETINVYNILLAQHCWSINKEKTREYFKKSYLPKTNGYILIYRSMRMRYGQTKEEFENSYEVLKREYYNNKAAIKSLDKLHNFWLPYYGTNPSQDIHKVYNYHHKNNVYSNAISLFILIYYYKNENNLNKVEELKKEFVSKYGILTELSKDLNSL